MTLEVSGTLTTGEKSIPILFPYVKSLPEFETLCAQIGNTTTTNFNHILLGLGTYYFLVNNLSKEKCVVGRVIRNLYRLK